MGLIIGLLKFLVKVFIYIAIVIAIILLIPNLPPYTKFTSIEIEPTQPRTGALTPNGDLNNVEKLYIDKLVGPEAFQVWNGEVYTGLATGEIVKISHGGHVTFVTQIGQPCTGLVDEHICGRPLGFVIDEKNKNLYVADAYHGIWKVDLKTYKKQLLVSPRAEIEGRKPMLFNSVVLANNGDLYWTDSTSDYHLKDGALAIISDPSGRLFRYNPAKNESTVLLDHLWFANGVIISPDNQFLLLAETNRMRILKYYIDGPKKGTSEVFISGLPGTPDTIRVLPDGSGVLVALYAAFDDDHPLLLKSLSTTPLARKAAARIMRLLEIPFEFLNTHFPHIIFEQIVYTIGHFATISGFGPGLSGLVQVDWNGNVVASYYNTDNSIDHISDAVVYNDKLYLGCPHVQNFIGSVPAPPLLKKAFHAVKSSPMPTKPAAEKQVHKKEKKLPIQESRKIEKPEEQKQPQEEKTVKPQSHDQKVKTTPVTQSEPKPTPVPKESVKMAVKEDTVKIAPKLTETKPKMEAVPESPKPKTDTTKKTSESKEVPVSKPKTAPKVEPKKDAPKVDIKKPEAVEIKSKVTGNEKSPPSAEVPSKSSTAKPEKAKKSTVTDEPQIIVERVKPEKAKTDKKTKKSSVPDEPQIIVQKVVPDVIPVVEEIPVDTTKPKDESLKVIKKSGPIEIPTKV